MGMKSDEPDFYVLDDDDNPHTPAPSARDHAHQTLAIDHSKHVAVSSDKKEYFKFAGVLIFLALAASLMSGLYGFSFEEWMRWFMGGFFIVFGSFKLIGLEMFVIAFRGYDIIAKKYRPYTYVYPFIEIFLGICYALNIGPVPRDIFTIVLMVVGAYGVLKALEHKDKQFQCACLGNIIRLPLTTVSLIENLGMAFMAFIMLLATLFL